MMYTIDIDQKTAEVITKSILEKIRKDAQSVGIMEACSILLHYLGHSMATPVEEYKDSGFTDDFGVHME